MKKLFLLIAVVVASASVASAQNWAVGARVGSGFQAVGQYFVSDANYIEARFGAAWINRISYSQSIPGTNVKVKFKTPVWTTADFSALYMWRVLTPNWTPGEWFLDAGVGLNVGGRENWAYVGAQGSVKLGYTFVGAPVSLSFDWSPAVGGGFLYGGGANFSGFNDLGLANMGLTCTYNF